MTDDDKQPERVERVARAIYEAFKSADAGEYVGSYGKIITLDGEWNLDDIARAAIKALK